MNKLFKMNTNNNQESFRDSIGTITEDGLRNWIHPKKPKGKFHNYRLILSIFLLILFIIGPFIKVNGEQFMLFDILERKFHIFGRPFFPQDFYLLALAAVISVVFIVLFTVVYGRIFCGWLCPQTIFMEMVFRKIEYFFEGDRPKQIKLDKMPWNAEKIRRRFLKWIVFYLISLVLTSVMLAYVAGSDYVINFWKHPLADVKAWIIYLIFNTVFFFVFAWFREQVCIIACPYGRLQGVLTDENTIMVAYDYNRGEKRGIMRKGQNREAEGLGDCIDCKQCVLVCPTGIDIRNGTQMECINCTACMDACDAVMDSIGKPRGLIRYASKVSLEEGHSKLFTGRVKFYTAVLIVLLGVFTALFVNRPSIDLKVLRNRATTHIKLPDGRIQNLYNATIINKSNHPYQDLEIKLIDMDGEIIVSGDEDKLNLDKEEVKQVMLMINLEKGKVKGKQEIKIGVYDKGKLIDTYETVFVAPVK
jgi:cytochrome c oxidase accessory protein FixG